MASARTGLCVRILTLIFVSGLVIFPAHGSSPTLAAARPDNPSDLQPNGTPAQPALLYLNRCVGNCLVQPGPDDAVNNRSSLVNQNRILPEFTFGDASWNALTQCVRRVYAEYFIEVIDVDPGNVLHRELMIGGFPVNLGQSTGILGVAPWACGIPVNNAIGFVFSEAIGNFTEQLCWTATHEAGHLFGLDHEFHQPDSMSYLPITTHYKHFTTEDMPCGQFSAAPCNCGATQTQNTDARLANEQGRDRVFAHGMGEDPWLLPEGMLMPDSLRSTLSCGTRTDRASVTLPVPPN